MSNFVNNGSVFRISADDAMRTYKKLPVGTYVIKFDDNSGQFFLETTDAFTISGKMYGDVVSRTERILNTYHERSANNTNTGVMLAGEKGSGKSLLAKNISIQAAKEGIPTVIVNQPYAGDSFNRFLQLIDHECVIVFDEYEKIYDRDKQELLLTLFDGVYQSRKLFILTVNDTDRVDSHLRNRPGRVYYMINYESIAEDFIREYCADNLKHVEHVDTICNIACSFSAFNFDMLKAMVEEINRYNESPSKAVEMLNVKIGTDGSTRYEVQLTVDGIKVDGYFMEDETDYLRPMSHSFSVIWDKDIGGRATQAIKDNAKALEDYEDGCIVFEPSDIVSMNSKTGTFVLEKGIYKVKLIKYLNKRYDLLA